jgi:creatinine amidohydrolase
MATRYFSSMTWKEVDELDKGNAVVVLPIGAVEAHGPHLPLATDGIIAESMARAAARRLSARGSTVLILPALVYTSAGFAAEFAGTVSLPPEHVTRTIVGIARGVAGQGFRMLALANAHLDPAHLRSLHDAAAACGKDGTLAVVFPDLTRKPWALRLGEEFKTGACHAGQFETSVVLSASPELVRENVRRALPPNPASLSAAIREGKTTFAEAGGPDAYFGRPAEASAAEGEATIEALGAILEEAVLAAKGRG